MKDISQRVSIIESRIMGVEKGERLDWEDLEHVETVEVGAGQIIVVRGEKDLAHSVHSDLQDVKTIDSPFEVRNEYHIVVMPRS